MSIIYDYIVIGGGPGGILSTYHLLKNRPNKKILLIEKNENTLDDYREEYEDISRWFEAQNDTKYQYAFQSEDSKTIWMGKGLGGGTLHFGLQYIDQPELIEKDHNNLKEYFEKVNAIIQPDKYNYDDSLPNKKWSELYTSLNNNKDENTLIMNNKIYGKNINNEERKRILLGDLIKDLKNVEILYNTSIKKVEIQNNIVDYVESFNNKKYYGNRIILASGAIQNPAILQRSNIDCGNKLYDHAGFTLIYKKMKSVENKIIKENVDGYTSEELKSLGLNIYNIDDNDNKEYNLSNSSLNSSSGIKAMHAVFRHSKLNEQDVKTLIDGTRSTSSLTSTPSLSLTSGINYVYDMGSYWNGGGHSGGSMYSRLGSSYNLTRSLIGRHGNSYWRLLSGGAKLVGVLRSSKTEDSEITTTIEDDLKLEPEKIVGHLQTRNKDLTWQTYYSILSIIKDSLIVTYAQSTNLSGNGSVKIVNKQENINPKVTLNHFLDVDEEGNNIENEIYINELIEAFNKNNQLLTSAGYTLDGLLPEYVTKDFVKQQANSIYHYHGSCSEVVDENNKVKDVDNLYIADISVLSKPWGGSTSVPAAVMGYMTANKIIENEDIENNLNKILYKYSIDETNENTLVLLQINKLRNNVIYKLDFETNNLHYTIKNDNIGTEEEVINEKYDVIKYYVKKNEKDTNSNFIFNKDVEEINKNISETIEFIPNNIYIIENLENNNLNFGTSWKNNKSNIIFISNSKNEKKVKEVSCINSNETIIFSINDDFEGEFYCFSYDNENLIDKMKLVV